MNALETPTEVQTLEERLQRGLDFLFEREQRGDTGPDFDRWFDAWLGLLARYRQLAA